MSCLSGHLPSNLRPNIVLILLLIALLVLSVPCSYSSSTPPRRLLLPRLSSSSAGPSFSSSSTSNSKYTVIFDAGSTGSRVHVYCFDANLQLVKFDDGDFEFYDKVSPGLSAYAGDPEAAAKSLTALLDAAIDVVPEERRAETPVRLGATAGLRLLEGEEEILEAVIKLFEKSPFKFESDWVSILDGSQEGSYSWIAINYLLGNIGQNYGGTAGSVDLGGGSLQMAYAISDEVARNASAAMEGVDDYVTELSVLGMPYHLYVYSYLRYGLMAARAEVLNLVNDSESCPCIVKGYQGVYEYDSVTYKAVGSRHGANYWQCHKLVVEALNVTHSCAYPPCTFNGVWSGGGGGGQKNLYVASYFFDRATQTGIINDTDAIEAVVEPKEFAKVAREVCKLSLEDIGELYPTTYESDRPYLCLDLTYEYALLVNGFGLHPSKNITLVSAIVYNNTSVDATWTLGNAIVLLNSSSPSSSSL